MTIDEIVKNCEHLLRKKNYAAIDRLLDNVSATDLIHLTTKFLEQHFIFEYALIFACAPPIPWQYNSYK